MCVYVWIDWGRILESEVDMDVTLCGKKCSLCCVCREMAVYGCRQKSNVDLLVCLVTLDSVSVSMWERYVCVCVCAHMFMGRLVCVNMWVCVERDLVVFGRRVVCLCV